MSLTREERAQIEALASDLNTEIRGDISWAFWPFPILYKLFKRITNLEKRIAELEK